MQLDFDFDVNDLGKLPRYRRVLSSEIKAICNSLGVGLVGVYSIDAVTASVASEIEGFDSNTVDGWIHLNVDPRDEYVTFELAKALALRVAIEKSILNWATVGSKKKVPNWFRAPYSSGFVRKWPVELLIDRTHVSEKFAALRNSLNLPAVRSEVLEAGRHWWTFLGGSIGLIALISAFFK